MTEYVLIEHAYPWVTYMSGKGTFSLATLLVHVTQRGAYLEANVVMTYLH